MDGLGCRGKLAQARQEGDFVLTEWYLKGKCKGPQCGPLLRKPSRVGPGLQAPATSGTCSLCGRQAGSPSRSPGLLTSFTKNLISHVCLPFSFGLAVLPPVFPCSQGLVSGGPEVHGGHRKQTVR